MGGRKVYIWLMLYLYIADLFMEQTSITPTIDELTREPERNLRCIYEGCNKIFSHRPALNMHLTSTHKLTVWTFSSPAIVCLRGSQASYRTPHFISIIVFMLDHVDIRVFDNKPSDAYQKDFWPMVSYSQMIHEASLSLSLLSSPFTILHLLSSSCASNQTFLFQGYGNFKKKVGDEINATFLCPVEGCVRSQEGRGFPRLQTLKQVATYIELSTLKFLI